MATTPAHKTIAELKDIVYNDMKGLYDRGEAENDIRDVLRLERKMEREVERRNTDARIIIKAMTDRLEDQQREVVIPSEEKFVARVREVEQERAQAASHIEEQLEAAEARERDIERMRSAAEETEAAIERTVEAHTVEMPRVQNSIGLYAHITGIKWNYDTEGEIMAGWLLPRGAAAAGGDGAGDRERRDGATVEGFQFDAAGKGDFEVANKLWDIIDGRARALVEA